MPMFMRQAVHFIFKLLNMDSCYHAVLCRNTSSVSSGRDLLSSRGSQRNEDWNSDLLGCCSEPALCMSNP